MTDVNTFVENRQSNVLTEEMNCDTREVSNDLELPVPVGGEASDKKDSGEESDEEDNEILNNFITVLDAFKEKVVASYDKTLWKGVKYFTKKLQKFSKQNNTSLEKSLFSIGKELSGSKTGGRKKKKNSKLIPVQVTAKSRREYKHRGRVVGNIGRRPKDQEQRKQMVVTDEAENVHSIPNRKKLKTSSFTL